MEKEIIKYILLCNNDIRINHKRVDQQKNVVEFGRQILYHNSFGITSIIKALIGRLGKGSF